MKSSLRALLIAVTPVITTLAFVEAAAADDVLELELTIPIALVDRSTAGVGGAPAGYGYENDAGLGVGLDARLYWASGSHFSQGIAVASITQAGPAFGAGGVAFHTVYIDVGYTARINLPCISRSSGVRTELAGILGVTGAYADAGTGVGGGPNGPDLEARERAAVELDHGGVGWRLAVDMSFHIDQFIVGVGIGGRQYFAIDSMVARVWEMDVGMRIGGRFDIGGRTEEYYYGYNYGFVRSIAQ